MKIKLMVLVVGLCVASVMQAQATKTIMDARHGCKVSIPGAWKVNSILTSGNTVDNSMDAGVAAGAPGQTLAQVKENRVKFFSAVYIFFKLTEDSGQAFQVEASNMGSGPKDGVVYRASVLGPNVCIIQVNYHTGDAGPSRAIAATLAATK